MAFPDNYQENTTTCAPRRIAHEWSVTGHPLSHRCTYCHRPKWVTIPPAPIPDNYRLGETVKYGRS